MGGPLSSDAASARLPSSAGVGFSGGFLDASGTDHDAICCLRECPGALASLSLALCVHRVRSVAEPIAAPLRQRASPASPSSTRDSLPRPSAPCLIVPCPPCLSLRSADLGPLAPRAREAAPGASSIQRSYEFVFSASSPVLLLPYDEALYASQQETGSANLDRPACWPPEWHDAVSENAVLTGAGQCDSRARAPNRLLTKASVRCSR